MTWTDLHVLATMHGLEVYRPSETDGNVAVIHTRGLDDMLVTVAAVDLGGEAAERSVIAACVGAIRAMKEPK